MPEDVLQRPGQLRHRAPELPHQRHIAAGAHVPPLLRRRLLQELDQVEPLEVLVVEVVQLVREHHVEVLVTPRPGSSLPNVLVHVALEMQVLCVAGAGRQTLEGLASRDQMVALLLGEGDGRVLGDRSSGTLLGREAHPSAGLGALVDAELQGTATGDAAEDPRELVVVFELEPVHETVLALALVHPLEEREAVQRAQRLRSKARTEV